MCGVNDIGPFRGINDFLVDTFYRNYYYFEREIFFFLKGNVKNLAIQGQSKVMAGHHYDVCRGSKF